MAKKLQKKNPKVVWRAGDSVKAVYQAKNDEDAARIVALTAKDAAFSHVNDGGIPKEDADKFIRMVTKAEKATEGAKAVAAINKAFEEFDIATGGGCGSSSIQMSVSIDADIPEGFSEEYPLYQDPNPQYGRLSLSNFARLRLKDGRALEYYDDQELHVVVGTGKEQKVHKVTKLDAAVKKAQAAPAGTKVVLYGSEVDGDPLSTYVGKFGAFVYK